MLSAGSGCAKQPATDSDYCGTPQGYAFGGPHNLSYGVSYETCSTPDVLTFTSYRDEQTRERARQELDRLALPGRTPKQRFVLGFCEAEGVTKGSISAIVEGEGTPWYPRTVAAWSANPSTQRFEIIDPEAVRCFNEGYGHHE